MTDPVFHPGQKITPVYTNGYNITIGKEYVVVTYEPVCVDVNYTWPAYVHFVDDYGKKCIAHAKRFMETPSEATDP